MTGVALGGGGGGGAAEAVGEGGEEQETAGGERVAPGAGDAHCAEAAGGANVISFETTTLCNDFRN